MKRIAFFSVLLGFASVSFAQEDKIDLKLVKDGVIQIDGKLFKIDKEGNATALTSEYDLGNGTKVSKNGDVSWNSGFKSKLQDGEVVLKNGNLGVLQTRVKTLNGYIRKEGKMYEILSGDLRSFEGDKAVTDSNKLSTDGKYFIGKSGKYVQIGDNEVVTKSGEIILSVEAASSQESYVIKRDAVVLKAVNNKIAVVDADYLFPNGMKVTPQGQVTTKEGVSFTLRNNEKLNSRGELFLNNENLFSNGLVKKDGLVYVVKDGKVSILNEDYAPTDSVRVTTNGIVTSGSRHEKFVMKDGDIVSLDGKLMVASSGCADATKVKKDRFVLDHILYKEGKLFIIKDAETSLLTKDIVLGDGSKILKTGHVIKPNGSKIQLHEGHRIAITGEELPDEKPEETTNPDKNYLTMLRGRIWLVTDGKPALLKEDYNIKNKMIVKTDGFVQKSDGSKIVLKENDRLSLDGVLIALDKRPQPGQLPNEYYIMKIGKMWMVHEGKPTKLDKDVVTADGVKILLDGTIIKKDKQRFQLKENDKVDSKGEIVTGK